MIAIIISLPIETLCDMKNILIILLGFNLLLLSSCQSFFKIQVEIDNPTESVLVVSLDGKTYEIPANSTIEVNLVKGEHAIEAKIDGKETYNGIISVTNDGLLNLCNSTYVIHKEIYLADQDKYIEFAEQSLKLNDVSLNNRTYQNVDFEVFKEEVFVPQHWDYGLNDELPEEITASEGEYAIVSKLYRIKTLEKEWGFYGDFDFSGNSDEELQHFLDSLNNHIHLLEDSLAQ